MPPDPLVGRGPSFDAVSNGSQFVIYVGIGPFELPFFIYFGFDEWIVVFVGN